MNIKLITFILLLILGINSINAAVDDAVLYYSFDEDNRVGNTMIDLSATGEVAE